MGGTFAANNSELGRRMSFLQFPYLEVSPGLTPWANYNIYVPAHSNYGGEPDSQAPPILERPVAAALDGRGDGQALEDQNISVETDEEKGQKVKKILDEESLDHEEKTTLLKKIEKAMELASQNPVVVKTGNRVGGEGFVRSKTLGKSVGVKRSAGYKEAFPKKAKKETHSFTFM